MAPPRIGAYELGALIGSGGMAEVFLARKVDRPDGAPVVLKRMFPHLARDPKFVQMFLTEVRLSALLDHPNIVPVVDSGVADGTYFLAMDLVDGCELGEIMRTCKPGPDELVGFAVAVVHKIALALAYAHDFIDVNEGPLRIVHRDVSPSNVMVDREGRVRLLDFGIAKAMASNDSRTLSGTVKGKASYMSPQQALGLKIDHRADIFAAGVVFHELLTGRRLFKTDNDIATLKRVSEAAVAPPSLLNPAVPEALDAICLRALAREEGDRWQHARALADALAPFVTRLGWDAPRLAAQVSLVVERRVVVAGALEETRAAPVSHTQSDTSLHTRGTSRRSWVALGGIAALMVGVAVWSALRTPRPAPAVHEPVGNASVHAVPAVSAPPVVVPPAALAPVAPVHFEPPAPSHVQRVVAHDRHRVPAKKPASPSTAPTRIDLESARPPE